MKVLRKVRLTHGGQHPTEWLSGSGGIVKTLYQLSRNFWQNAPVSKRRNRCPLETM